MKLIKGLEETIKNFQGKVLEVVLEKGADPIPLTVKEAIVTACGSVTTRELGNGKDMILAHSVGQKIWNSDGELVLEDQEIELVKKIIEKNQSYNALVIGTLLKLIEGAEDYAVNKTTTDSSAEIKKAQAK